MEHATGEWEISTSPEVLLTVGSSVWRYLASEMIPDDDYLVLSWSNAGWIAGVLPRDFPGGAEDAVEARLDQYTVLIPHAGDLKKLHGHKLQYEAGVLSVV